MRIQFPREEEDSPLSLFMNGFGLGFVVLLLPIFTFIYVLRVNSKVKCLLEHEERRRTAETTNPLPPSIESGP